MIILITNFKKGYLLSTSEVVNLSLIVPCYNEVETLANCIQKIQAVENENLSIECVIVDDCSTDKSLSVAEELEKKYENVKLFKHEVNMGKGAALRTGFVHATGDYIGIQDADEEYDAQEYKVLLKAMIDGEADVVYGSRYLRPSTRRVLYFWHTWMNKMLTLVTNMFTNLDITDMETCYKLFKREVIQKIAPTLVENRFGFEPEITVKVAAGDYNVYECAISYNPRSYEEGKKIGWKDGVRALYCIFHYGGSFAPLPMQILLYLFIGGFSALVNIVMFFALSQYYVEIIPISIAAFIIAAITNYFLCITILFQHKARWGTVGEVIAYIFTLIVMGALDSGVTVALTVAGFSMIASKVTAIFVGLTGNFIFRRFLVF